MGKLKVKAKQLTKEAFLEAVMNAINWSDDWALTVNNKAAQSVKVYTPDSEAAAELIVLYENPTLMIDAMEEMDGANVEINVIK